MLLNSTLVGQYDTMMNPSGKSKPDPKPPSVYYTGQNASFQDVAGQKTMEYYKRNGVIEFRGTAYDKSQYYDSLTSVRKSNKEELNDLLERYEKSFTRIPEITQETREYLDQLYTRGDGVFRDIIELPSGQVDLREETLKREIDAFKSRVDKLNIDKNIKDQIFSFGLANILQRVGQELTSADSKTGMSVKDEERVNLMAQQAGTQAIATAIERPTGGTPAIPQTVNNINVASFTPIETAGAGVEGLQTDALGLFTGGRQPRIILPSGVNVLQVESDLATQNIINPLPRSTGRPITRNYTDDNLLSLSRTNREKLSRIAERHTNPEIRARARSIYRSSQ